ncbi:cbb3-type cytochrome c oxidase subunit I [Opitutales bacterium ASA1]|uniref:cbb3-type cytochrome c oxidase subunit I n=1 Tax=Congregicoccus parvus TaxID=3081749 RepID=UPI002B2A6271|nr:cbb3-type cytochrome c oxidase subunit I [Opitutales bacterium ASA1]
MPTTPSLAVSLDPRTEFTPMRAELAEIDESTRPTTLLFVGASLFWLFVGTIFALIASWKMHHPAFLGESEWATFGRIRPAHLNTVIYGWGTNVAFAVNMWIMARLCRTRLLHAGTLVVACFGWNIGIAVGTVGILAGDGTSIEWLEFPAYASPMLFFSYALIGAWGIVMFRFRRSEHTYVSQWFILAALFWFPWLYSVAQIMLVFAPTIGVVQALTNWWFAHNILGLWFTPTGLAAAYYFIPKVLGKPIYSYHLSVLGFWTFALFYNWAGVHHLIGGPVPVWVQSAGIVASLLMVIPVVVTGINHHMTVVGSFGRAWASPTLRFIVFGAVNYTLTSLLGSLMSLRSVNQVWHFTHSTPAHAHHGMYAFFTMIMFGSLYFIVPRVLRKEWPSAGLIALHFWTTAGGIALYMVGLTIGGTLQGLQLNDPQNHPSFLEITRMTVPYLFSRSVAGVIILVGHVAFMANFVWMLLRRREEHETSPTLFNTPPALDRSAARG